MVIKVNLRGRHSIWWPWTTIWKGRKSRCVKLSSNLSLDMMMIPCGKCSTSDASGSFFKAAAVLCRPPKNAETYSKTLFLTFDIPNPMFIFRCARNVLWTSNMCSRNPLTLGLSDRSRRGVARCSFWDCSCNPVGILRDLLARFACQDLCANSL